MSGPPFSAFLHSGSTHDNNLVDCMPEEDRAALLPILKIAFPFLKCPHSDEQVDGDGDDDVAAAAMEAQQFRQQTQTQTQQQQQQQQQQRDARAVAEMAYCSNRNLLASPPLRTDAFSVNPRPSQSPSQHSRSIATTAFLPMPVSQYSFAPSSSAPALPPPPLPLPSSALHGEETAFLHADIKGLDADNAGFLGATFPDAASNFDSLLREHRASEPNDASSNVTDDKLSLSLASAPSDGDVLNTNSGLSMANLGQSHDYVSPEASCVHAPQENESSYLDHEVNCKEPEALQVGGNSANGASADGNNQDLVSCRGFDGCVKPLTEPSTTGIHRISDSENSLDLNNCADRDTIDDCLMELETKEEMYDFSVEREMANRCSPNSLADQEPEGEKRIGPTDAMSQLSCSGGNNQCSEGKPQQCRRSNGKQWQCWRNATPGLMYCEFHHDYQRKGKLKSPNEHGGAKQVSCPGTPEISGGSVTKNASGNELVPQQKREIDRSRCHRNDGKLWQCSKNALPGSIYCEHHHTKRQKKTKKDGSTRRTGKQSTPAAAVAGDGDRGSVSKQTLDPEHNLNDPDVAFATVRNSDADADVIRSNKRGHDGQLRGTAPKALRGHAYSGFSTCDEKGNLIQNDGKKDASHSILMGSHLGTWSTGHGGDSDLQKQTGTPERCHRKDGKKWQCAKFCMPGFSYCEYHQGRLRKSKVAVKEKSESAGAEPYAQVSLPEGRNMESSLDQKREAMEDAGGGDFEENVNVLLQCQSKDGKGWQCSLNSKPGFRYCEQHLNFSMSSRQREDQMLDCPLPERTVSDQERSSAATAAVQQPLSSCQVDQLNTATKHINMEQKKHQLVGNIVNFQNDPHMSMISHHRNFGGSYPYPMTHIGAGQTTGFRNKDHNPAVVAAAAAQIPHKSLYQPASCNARREETFTPYDAFPTANAYSLLQQQAVRNTHEPSLFAGGNAAYQMAAFRGLQMQGMYNAHQYSQGLYNVYHHQYHSREPFHSSSARLPDYCKSSTKVPGVPPDVENGS